MGLLRIPWAMSRAAHHLARCATRVSNAPTLTATTHVAFSSRLADVANTVAFVNGRAVQRSRCVAARRHSTRPRR